MINPTKNIGSKSWISIAALSLVFAGAYSFLRALPDAQCGFLHYVEIVNEDGEIELCATNHAGFIDLSVLTYPVAASLETEEPLRLWEKAQVALDLETSGGMSIAPFELAITHTEKMHVMVIDPSLEDYHHLHPEAEGLGGLYHFEFTPERAGKYRVFTEIVPVRSRRQAIALSELEVAGDAASPQFKLSTECVVGGVKFKLSGVPKTLNTGRDYRLELRITEAASGAPADLEVVMDAKGHMVAFDERAHGFAHMHPIDSVDSVTAAGITNVPADDSELAFLFNVPNSGWDRLFAQIQLGGEAVYGRFDLKVED